MVSSADWIRIEFALISDLSASANANFRASSSEANSPVKWAIGSGGTPMLGARDLARKLILRSMAEPNCGIHPLGGLGPISSRFTAGVFDRVF